MGAFVLQPSIWCHFKARPYTHTRHSFTSPRCAATTPNNPPDAAATSPLTNSPAPAAPAASIASIASSAAPASSSSPTAEPTANTRCGFVTLLGPSNSGKSTLLNRFVGHKVAIVTPKVQTTRCRVSGIAAFSDTQVIFLDTPGIFEPTNRFARAMVKSAWKSGRDGDAVALILDATKLYRYSVRSPDYKPPDTEISADIDTVLHGLARSRRRGRAVSLCICANKIDAVPESQRESTLQWLADALHKFELADDSIPLFPISARHGQNIDTFRDWVVSNMPYGPWLYADDDMTDMPARQLAAEVCREKAFMVLNHEIPYDIAVETTSYKDRPDGSIRITQDILVARESQKRIVTGSGGSVVKTIGMQARMELTEILGATVHLMLTVKVRSKWKEERWQYQQWGLDYNA